MSEAIHIRPQTPEDDARGVEIGNAIFHDMPALTVEEYRHFVTNIPSDAGRVSMVAERDGRMVGRAVWQRLVNAADPDAYRLAIVVDPAFQGRGTGSALYDVGIADLRRRGARKVQSSVRDDQPHAEIFASHRGFRRTGHGDRMSRLEVRSARLYACRAAALRVLESGIRIATLAELGTVEEFLHAIWEMERRTSLDVPSSMEWTGLRYEQWRSYVLEGPGTSLDSVWIAKDGDRPIGIATLRRSAGNTAENAYTGVDAAYRGRGIARALKLRTIEWAAQNGVEYIYTGNDVKNAQMLAINEDLGYEPLPVILEIELKLTGDGKAP